VFVDFTIMKKWTRLFVNGSECRGPIFTATKFFNSCQDGTNVSMCSEVMLKNNDTSAE
jgi:hypothetical protein